MPETNAIGENMRETTPEEIEEINKRIKFTWIDKNEERQAIADIFKCLVIIGMGMESSAFDSTIERLKNNEFIKQIKDYKYV